MPYWYPIGAYGGEEQANLHHNIAQQHGLSLEQQKQEYDVAQAERNVAKMYEKCIKKTNRNQ